MAEETAATAGDGESVSTEAPATATGEGAAVAGGGNDTKTSAAAVNWRDGLDGEHLEFAKRFASPQDMTKAALDLRKANGSMIRVPGKDAKPEDVAKFNKAIGAGENASAYEKSFPQPDGRDLTDIERNVQTKVAEVLHKHHVPVAAAGELHSVVHQISQDLETERERVALQGRENNEAQLRKEWGKDFESNVELARRAAKTFGGDEFVALINKPVDGIKLGDHPQFLKVFGQIRRRMGEGNFIGAMGQEEVASIEDEARAMTKAMLAAQNKGDRITANRLNTQIMELRAKQVGNAPIVGHAGRAV